MDRMVFVGATLNYFGLPRWIATHEKLFAEEGIDFQTIDVATTDSAGETVRAGIGHISTSAMEQIIIDRDAGGPLVAVAGNVNRLPFSLIASPAIKSIAELRGKRIGVSSLKTGTSAILTKLFAEHGLQPGDYTLIAVGPIDTRWTMLKSGEIDAGLQGVPQSLVAIDAGFSDLGSDFPDLQFSAYAVEENWARQNRPVLVRFFRAILRALDIFYADRDTATEIAMQYGGFSRDYASRAWEVYARNKVFPPNGDFNLPGLKAQIELSAVARGVPERAHARPEAYIDRSYLIEARRSLGRD